MNVICLSDITLKQKNARQLPFKKKIDLVKILDRLEVDVIETGMIETEKKGDALLVKTICEAVEHCVVSVEASCAKESIDLADEALKQAKRSRIQISAPVSLVQMEYHCHKKPEAMSREVGEAIAYAKGLGHEVEFLAIDASRAERDFLFGILAVAIKSGADIVSVCDTAGDSLPDAFAQLITDIKQNVEGIENVRLGFACNDGIALADASSIAAVFAGGQEAKASIFPEYNPSLVNIANILAKKGSEKGVSSSVRTVEMKRLYEQASKLFENGKSATSPFDAGVRTSSGRYFTKNDKIEAISREVKALGYELSSADQIRVFEEFQKIAEKKEQVSAEEIDVIVANTAMQVPPTYVLDTYLVTATNSMNKATAHVCLLVDGEKKDDVAMGDGPIDAAYLAIEKIHGMHYELDDFQIKSVTQGTEAMGETLVKLRSQGQVYAGQGISTDIIGSAINAYVNALNKIVYEGKEE